MSYVAAGEGWLRYISGVFGVGAGVLLIPGVLLGAVFPYLLRFAQTAEWGAGEAIGRLAAANTFGAIVGSIFAGFVLLGAFGLWGACVVFACGYVLMAFVPMGERHGRSPRAWIAPAGALLVVLTLLNPTRLPITRPNPSVEERVLETWEGHHGVVSVVQRRTGMRIKVNNFYSLGGTASIEHEQNQALIPLMTHPDPASVFFLGMGTGITAGAALSHRVEEVVVAELIPEVVSAAEMHFGPFTNGLFTDSRASVLVRDGRNELAGARREYDAIIADLFIPWKAGTGSLYALEHYRTARERLKAGGRYVQWIPLYQVTRQDFDAIARTMLDVFPVVTVWRGDFFPSQPILALVGEEAGANLSPDAIQRSGRFLRPDPSIPDYVFDAVTLPFYAGNLSAAPELIPSGPLNTDDRPVIEYGAPVSHRATRSGATSWFIGDDLMAFFSGLQAALPPEEDPYLGSLDPTQKALVRAGLVYHRAAVADRAGRPEVANRLIEEFLGLMPVDFCPPPTIEPSIRGSRIDFQARACIALSLFRSRLGVKIGYTDVRPVWNSATGSVVGVVEVRSPARPGNHSRLLERMSTAPWIR